MVVFEAFLVFEAPWKNHECMKKLPLCCVKMIACNQNVSLKKKKDTLCHERFFTQWKLSWEILCLLTRFFDINGIFWQAYLLFWWQLSFHFAFQCDRQFWQMHFTSHVDKIFIFQTKMWTWKHYCFFWAISFIFSCEIRQISKTNFKSSDSYNIFEAGKQNIKGFLKFLKTFMSGL